MTIFEKIIRREIPADIIWEDDDAVVFHDVNPQAPVHVLIVPREHIVSADTVEAGHADVLAEMMETAQAVARQEGLSDRGYRLVFNVGEDAQNSVAHLHMHVVGGRPMEWPPG